MTAIFKYPLSVSERQTIELPLYASIIRVEDVNGLLFLWAIVDTELEDKETRYLEFYKTGQPIENPTGLRYLGLCKLFIMQELGLYVFERLQPNQPYTT